MMFADAAANQELWAIGGGEKVLLVVGAVLTVALTIFFIVVMNMARKEEP
ncbi:MAG: hypothetical protein AAF432_01320 [Planctomycetota bacterium]